jgi:hypothetical protein
MLDVLQIVTYRKKVLFLVIVLLSWATIALFYMFIINRSLYVNTLGDQFGNDYIQNVIDKDAKMVWLSYIITPLAIAIRALMVSLILFLGTFYRKNGLKIGQLFGIALLADMVFLIPGLIKFLWFWSHPDSYDLHALQVFQPLSLLSIFDVNSLATWLVYPLQTLNIFEFIYLFVLAFGIQHSLKTSFDRSLQIVVTTYVPALVLWFVFIMFLTVTFSPA